MNVVGFTICIKNSAKSCKSGQSIMRPKLNTLLMIDALGVHVLISKLASVHVLISKLASVVHVLISKRLTVSRSKHERHLQGWTTFAEVVQLFARRFLIDYETTKFINQKSMKPTAFATKWTGRGKMTRNAAGGPGGQ